MTCINKTWSLSVMRKHPSPGCSYTHWCVMMSSRYSGLCIKHEIRSFFVSSNLMHLLMTHLYLRKHIFFEHCINLTYSGSFSKEDTWSSAFIVGFPIFYRTVFFRQDLRIIALFLCTWICHALRILEFQCSILFIFEIELVWL